MPSLYGFTSNSSNVSVTNTTGLYQMTGNVTIFNSAQSLYALLANSASIGFELVNNNSDVTAIILPSGVTSGTYGNTNYFPILTVGSDGRITSASTINISNITGTYSNTNVAAYLTTATISTTGNITGANLITAGNVYGNYVIGNGSLLTNLPVQQGTYSNTNVAAYLTTATISTTGNITGGNLITIGKGSFGNVTTTGTETVGNLITTNGVFWANGTAYSSGSGGVSQIIAGANITISPVGGTGIVTITANTQAGTYGNSNVAAYLIVNPQSGTYSNTNVSAYLTTATISTTGNITGGNITTTGTANVGIIQSTNGYFWSNGTAYSSGGSTGPAGPAGPAFSGNLAGNVLYDGTSGRVLIEASPLSPLPYNIPGSIFYYPTSPSGIATGNAALYSGNVITQLAVSTNSNSTIISATTANVAVQSSYNTGTNRTVTGTFTALQVVPVTANTMQQQDRIRAATTILEIDNPGYRWGVMTSAAQAAVTTTAAIFQHVHVGTAGNAEMSSQTAMQYAAQNSPTSTGSANVQYQNGSFVNLGYNTTSPTSTRLASNINIARMVTGSVQGAGTTAGVTGGNLWIDKAIGIHTYNGWAAAVAGTGVGQRYTVLNEDVSTIIQTAANIKFTYSNAGVAFGDGSFQTTAYTGGGSTYSNTNVASYLAVTQNIPIDSINITSSVNPLSISSIGGYLDIASTQANVGSVNYNSILSSDNQAQLSTLTAGIMLPYSTMSIGGGLKVLNSANVANNAITSTSISLATTSSGIFWANGASYNSTGYSNATVASYLPISTVNFGGNINTVSGNAQIVAASNVVDMSINTGALGIPLGANSARPIHPSPGSMRFNTATTVPEWYDISSNTWVSFGSTAPAVTYSVSYAVVAGGGGGAGNGGTAIGGGGGGGGVLTGSVTTSPGTTFTVSAGGGGAAGSGSGGSNGTDSTVTGGITLTAVGGGGGGYGVSGAGSAGGSGGGGAVIVTGTNYGAGTVGQGYRGGSGQNNGGGGGGGGSAVGSDATGGATNNGGNGGNGYSISIPGYTGTCSGGGGGGAYVGGGGTPGSGGTGGGGAGATASPATPGTNGGGGGGGSYNTSNVVAANGGGGFIILTVPTGNYTGVVSGASVSTSGGYTIMSFSGSGYYTA